MFQRSEWIGASLGSNPARARAGAGRGYAALAGLALALMLLPAASARAQTDYGRPGLYVGGSWSRAAENFDDDLDDELEEVLPFATTDTDVDDFDAIGAVIGLRSSPLWSVELVGERYRKLRIDLSAPGQSASAEVDLRAALLMTKLYIFAGPIQPYLMAGLGVVQARAESGGLSDRIASGMARAGLGLDLYLTPNLVLGVQGSYSQAYTGDFDDVSYFSIGGNAMLRF